MYGRNISGPVRLVLPGIYPASGGRGSGEPFEKQKKWQHFGNNLTQRSKKPKFWHQFGTFSPINSISTIYKTINHENHLISRISGNKFCSHSTIQHTRAEQKSPLQGDLPCPIQSLGGVNSHRSNTLPHLSASGGLPHY
jgi:hypothetical protein